MPEHSRLTPASRFLNRIPTLIFCWLLLSFSTLQTAHAKADQRTFLKDVSPFLATHCVRCHGAKKAEAGLRLDQIKSNFVSGSRDANTWREVMDRLNLGEMPPEDEPSPPDSEVQIVNGWILKELRRSVANSKDGAGQVVMRRLNRNEYNNTIHDLLGINLQPADVFPADGTAHGFDNIGRALMVSPLLMEKYLSAAETVLDRAIVSGPRPRTIKRRVEVEAMSRFFTRQKTLRTFNSNYLVRKSDFLLMTKSTVFLPMIDSFKFSTPGEYAFRVRASAVSGGSYPPRMSVTFDGVKIWEGDVDAPEDTPQIIDVRVPVEVSTSGGRRTLKVAYPNFNVKHTMPLVLDYMEIEGPIYDQWPPASHQRIFFRGSKAATTDVYAQEIISKFASRAFRRPVQPYEVAKLMKLFKAERDQQGSFEASIKVALTAVLCAHDFLFLVEPMKGASSGNTSQAPPERNQQQRHLQQRRLSEFELASRLSYFLWNSMPDTQLIQRAQQGTLSKPAVLEAEVRRMLRDSKSARFVKSFVGQWLQTRLVGAFPPDSLLFPDYDYHLETSMIRETEAFFTEILHNDLSVLNFIDSDFAMLNERIARHYGIAGVKGDEFRRVQLPANSHRGGVLTHASILAGLSDGTRTKPIKRGVWILENLLADPPPPPPPNAGEIEPNKKGTESLSLRQRMAQHRTNPTCASCHRKIDPLGFSLQNYDAIGAWRTHEVGVKTPIDASGELNGKRFNGPDEFKKMLLNQKQSFCRCLTEKLMTYALGRGLEITDREAVNRISQHLHKTEYRMIDLILNITKSDVFQSK